MTRAAEVFDERLRVPLWWWPAGLAISLLFAAELHGGVPGPQAVVPYAVLLPGALLVLAALSRARVTVGGGVLEVPGGQRLDLAAVGRAIPADPRRTRALLASTPTLVVARRPWVTGAVEIHPRDGTAPWLVSTRRPAELAAALTGGVPPAS